MAAFIILFSMDWITYIKKTVDMVVDIAWSVWWYVIPQKRAWDRAIECRAITDHALAGATLFQHGELPAGGRVEPAVFFHGDKGHPYSMYGLIKEVTDRPVFSVWIPDIENVDQLDANVQIMKSAITKVGRLVGESGGLFNGVKLVGHSKGATLAAHCKFVEMHPHIKSVTSIAGRLCVPEGDNTCPDKLRSMVRNIHSAVLNNPPEQAAFTQIVGSSDWCFAQGEDVIPLENGTIITPPNSDHLSVLYVPETVRVFSSNF
jgi:hypothetical protein